MSRILTRSHRIVGLDGRLPCARPLARPVTSMAAVAQILLALRSGVGAAAQGQQVFTSTQSWTVPNGVTSISMVCITEGHAGTIATETYVSVSSTKVCRAIYTAYGTPVGDASYNGGNPGTSYYINDGEYGYGGAGGAAGYSGVGGDGSSSGALGDQGGINGAGGGGGGSGMRYAPATAPAAFGGGVGLLGIGANGSGGINTNTGPSSNSAGGPGSGGSTSNYGGGLPAGFVAGNYWGGDYGGSYGGCLAYKNNVAVTPGQSISLWVGTGWASNGAIRIIWGPSRSYPSAAGDVAPIAV